MQLDTVSTINILTINRNMEIFNKEKHPHFWKATYISFMFMLIYSPQNVVLNILGDLMEDSFGDLGFSVDAVLYLS